MKKSHLLIALIAVFAIAGVLPHHALAEHAPDRPFQPLQFWKGADDTKRDAERKHTMTPEERAERLKDRKAHFHDKLASSSAAIRTRFTGQKKAAVEGHLDAMYNRFDSVVERLTTLADRIEAHIDTAREDGKDVDAAVAALADARTAIDEADDMIDETKDTITAALADESSISREGLRELVTQTKDAIKTAHHALVETVRTLKEAQK